MEQDSLFDYRLPVEGDEYDDADDDGKEQCSVIGNGGEFFVAAILKNGTMVPPWCGRCFIEFQEQGRVFDLRATSADEQHQFRVQVKTLTRPRRKGHRRELAYDFQTAKVHRRYGVALSRRLYEPGEVDLFALVAEDRFSAVFIPAHEITTTGVTISPTEFTIENQRATLCRSLDAILARRKLVVAVPVAVRSAVLSDQQVAC